jgi:hypothetical protein
MPLVGEARRNYFRIADNTLGAKTFIAPIQENCENMENIAS